MSIETNLSVSPYFDDFDDSKNYAKILFQPATAVQVRELNQVQTMIQDQIEKFGDHIFQRGTIISGCQPTFLSALRYVTLTDTTTDNSSVDVYSYRNYKVKNTTGVSAEIVHVIPGYESTFPNLNTLYLKYTKSNFAGDVQTFAAGEPLTIFDTWHRIEKFKIETGGAGSDFANSDVLLVLSALEVSNSTGGKEFSSLPDAAALDALVGQTITQSTTGSQATIVSVNSTAKEDRLIISIKPITSQLAIGNTASWSFQENLTDSYLLNTTGGELDSNNSDLYAYVGGFVGTGASGSIRVTTSGGVSRINLTSKGSGYYVTPHVTVYTNRTLADQQSFIDTIDDDLRLSAQNYKAGVTVSTANNSVGLAYAMKVTEGMIYQKGFFVNVKSQFAIIQKYNNKPNDLYAGFITQESIANSSIDSTLFDNAGGFTNYSAPGANRLKLEPVLTTKSFEETAVDENFLGIWGFKNGELWTKKEDTEYSAIGEEMAKRTYQESGHFVVSGFEGITASTTSISDTDTNFNYKISSGEAYVAGYRVKTPGDRTHKVQKALKRKDVANNSIKFSYGNYVDVYELAGDFSVANGDQITLYDVPLDAISTHQGDVVAAASGLTAPNAIGKARIRAIEHDQDKGPQGQANTRYKVYLTDIKMNTGKNFYQVASMYDSVSSASADLLLQVTDGAGAGRVVGAVLKDPKSTSLIYNTASPVFEISNIKYNFRRKDEQASVTAGTVSSVTINAATNYTFPYGSVTLTSTQENDLIVIPQADVVATTNFAGTVSGSGTTLTGDVNTTFLTDLQSGDYIIADSQVVKVIKVLDDDSLEYSPSATITASSTFARVYPQNIPLPVGDRANINVVATSSSLVINLPIDPSPAVNYTVSSIQQFDASHVDKTVQRSVYVKLQANTHLNSTTGPWCLGHSDVIRLRGVWTEASTGVTESTGTNITDKFLINQKQHEGYYDLAQLELNKNLSYTIGANDVLLVKFDILEHSDNHGIKTFNSYPNANTTGHPGDESKLGDLISAGTYINTLEIPEFVDTKGRYYDLRESLDFRPVTASTANVVTTDNSVNMTTNPKIYGTTAQVSADSASYVNDEHRFKSGQTDVSDPSTGSSINLNIPLPGSFISFDKKVYLPRKDTIILNTSGDTKVYQGGLNSPSESEFVLYNVNVAAYPSYAQEFSASMNDINRMLIKKDFSDSLQRVNRYTTKMLRSAKVTKRWTMSDISQLEKRIKSLEDYVMLNEKENSCKDLRIPSSVDPSLDRFKYGFFVENCKNKGRTHINSNEHTATFYQNKIQPQKRSINVPLKLSTTSEGTIFGNKIHYGHTKRTLVIQDNVTAAPVVPPPPDPPPEDFVEPVPVLPVDPEPGILIPIVNAIANTITIEIVPVPIVTRGYYVTQEVLYNTERYASVWGTQALVDQNIHFANTLEPAIDTTRSTPAYEVNVFKFSSNSESQNDTITLNFNLLGGYDRFVIFRSETGKPSDMEYVTDNQSGYNSIQNLSADEKRRISNETDDSRWTTSSDYNSTGTDNFFLRNVGYIEFEHIYTKPYVHVYIFKASPKHRYYIEGPVDDVPDIELYSYANYPGAPEPEPEPEPVIITPLPIEPEPVPVITPDEGIISAPLPIETISNTEPEVILTGTITDVDQLTAIIDVPKINVDGTIIEDRYPANEPIVGGVQYQFSTYETYKNFIW